MTKSITMSWAKLAGKFYNENKGKNGIETFSDALKSKELKRQYKKMKGGEGETMPSTTPSQTGVVASVVPMEVKAEPTPSPTPLQTGGEGEPTPSPTPIKSSEEILTGGKKSKKSKKTAKKSAKKSKKTAKKSCFKLW